MIISRVAILLALLSLLIAIYCGSSPIPALLRSGVVFLVAYAVMFVVQIMLISIYRKVREAEMSEARKREIAEEESLE
jgi:ABC-type multidrug transport system permease subunit